MKKNIFAAVLFFAAHCAISQVSQKLSAVAKEISYNKLKQPVLVTLKETSPIDDSKIVDFINSAILTDGIHKAALLKTDRDEYGFSHSKFAVLQNGVTVSNKVIIAHCKNGKLASINGDLYTPALAENKFSISEKSALNFALKKVHAKKYKWENKAEEAHMREVLNQPGFSYYPVGAKVIFEKAGKYFSAYQFTIYAEQPLYKANVFVDAANGKILGENNLICDIDVPGTAATKYSGTQTITCDQNGASFRLKETQRGLGIETYNMNYTSNYTNINFTNTSANWSTTGGADQGARDAHWGAEKTYDYYFSQHNRNSIDGFGFKLVSYVHYQTNYSNAFWDGLRMTYGDGNGSSTKIFTALDVCGHEITHGLTSNTSGLNYSYESGALNESYSDIFGTAIENFARPSNWNWKVGEDLTTNNAGLRNMANPGLFGNPDTYMGTYWYVGSGDNGGVHTNSGVSNYWFYLLTMGGSGTNDLGNAYSVTSIGITAASRIAFRANTVYFTPTTDYPMARVLTLQAAKDLYGDCSAEYEQTAKAWYGVGVGGPYSNSVVAPDFLTYNTSFCNLPATVSFTNLTSNGQSYSWSFGDGGVASTQHATHSYTANGTYSVKLKATGCFNQADSITKTSYITVNIPPAPVSNGGSICGLGVPATLTATGTGTLNWFFSQFSQPVASGNVFITPNLSANATFYVSNAVANPPAFGGLLTNVGTGGGTISNALQFLKFDVFQNCNLLSVVAYANSTGPRTVELRDVNGILNSTTVNLVSGANVITLNYPLTPGTDYELGLGSSSLGNLYRSTTGINYPYNVGGCLSITGASSPYYFYFYNWKVSKADCMSPPVAVTATLATAPVSSMSAPQTLVCSGESPIALSGFPSGGNFSGTNVSGSLFNPATSGDFLVVYNYADPNGCSDTSSVLMKVNACTGINSTDRNNLAISIYPNPATDQVTIDNDFGSANVTITDAVGRVVFSQQIAAGTQVLSLNVLAKGLYIVNITDQQSDLIKTVKLIKE